MRRIPTSLSTPTSAVTSINGDVGDVVIDKNTLGLQNVDNTSDLDKPLSTAVTTKFGELTKIEVVSEYPSPPVTDTLYIKI